jgi:hypothetical protein
MKPSASALLSLWYVALPLARADDALSHPRRAFALRRGVPRQLLEPHHRHVDVDVDAVEQRPRNAPDVALNLQRRAAALARRVVEIPARASPRCHFAISA